MKTNLMFVLRGENPEGAACFGMTPVADRRSVRERRRDQDPGVACVRRPAGPSDLPLEIRQAFDDPRSDEYAFTLDLVMLGRRNDSLLNRVQEEGRQCTCLT